MQDLSFNFKNAELKYDEFKFSVMIYSFSNAYSLDPSATVLRTIADGKELVCSNLLTHGGQTKAPGSAKVVLHKKDKSVAIDICAAIDDSTEEIRSVKLCADGFDIGKIINLIDSRPRDILESGLRFKYPEGWRDAGTPLVIIEQPSGRFLYFRSCDTKVREKTFVFSANENKLHAELIFEEDAMKMRNEIVAPTWEIGFSSSVSEISALHQKSIEEAYHLLPWETRPDVPDWARDISLVAAIHAQHWTGYIFNDYEDIIKNLEWLCNKIDGKRILAFIPGWEGRYYWKYGNYGPDERMGGEQGFRKLCECARKLGVHLMPMFGINVVGVHHAGFAEWGEPCELRTGSGNISRASVDWDGSRHFDHSSNRTMNPGAPKWQNRLVQQITSLSKEYGFDGAFLDIAAVWSNDPNHNVYEGVQQLTRRVREECPNMLIAGEGWYDALAACIPLLQCGHTDGKLHWHDDAYAPMLDTYARNFGHLCLGDPSRLSTGVHEQGANPEWRTPLRKGVIPTITIVDDTIESAPKKVMEIINDAKEYAKRFIQ